MRELIGIYRSEDVERLLWWMNHQEIGPIMMVTESENIWALGGGEKYLWLHFPIRIEEPVPVSVILNIFIS